MVPLTPETDPEFSLRFTPDAPTVFVHLSLPSIRCLVLVFFVVFFSVTSYRVFLNGNKQQGLDKKVTKTYRFLKTILFSPFYKMKESTSP